MLYLWENSGKVQDMPAEEDQNSQKENGLTLIFENKPQIEQHVRDTPQDKSGNDQLRGMSTAAARYAEDHETERGEALQNDSGIRRNMIHSPFLSSYRRPDNARNR